MLYCLGRFLFLASQILIGSGVLGLAYLLETLQYFKVSTRFTIDNPIILLAVGTLFDWWDILAYTFGIAVAVLFHTIFVRKKLFSYFSTFCKSRILNRYSLW